ncbi:MAG: leucine-rich repeat protein, partial [Alistipes sp.]|nr:leucine-rich repeat protein [Alistipes sp.]
SGMKYLSIPNSIASIGQYAFHGCTGELVVNCNIPASKYSAEGVFFYSKFESVTIGDSVTTIGDYAFYNNSAMTTVTIGKNITSIGQYAFSNCSALTRVNISDMRAWLNIDFATATANPLNYAKNLYFNGSLVESVTIPSDMTEVKPYTFVHSTSLKSVILHSGITSIGKYAFRGCVKLSNITIPDRVTLIGERAFYDCESFTSVTIPASVTSIEIYAFYGCGALESVYCKPTTPPTGSSSMFYGNASNRKIYVPKNSVDAYKSAEYWNTYKNYIEGYNF